MKIVVLAKDVPDTYGERTLNPETGLADRAGGDNVIDEIDGRALEVALRFADASPGTEIAVLSMGPEGATANLRKCLAMGADSVTHVMDENLRGADLSLTAEVLARALTRIGFDLVIAGNQSTDGSGGVLPAMLAEHLGLASVTNLNSLELSEVEVHGERVSDGASLSVRAPFPAVVSVTEQLPDARFPSFKGIMAAKKKPFETLDLADLGIDASDLGSPRAIMISISERPPRAAGQKIVDAGDAGTQLAGYLLEHRLV